MTRSGHIIEIFNEIGQHAGFTVLDQYEESNQVAFDKTSYSFIVTESEEAWFEDAGAFQMTSTVMMYIDFKIDDFGENYTELKNQIIQDVEDARVQADLTLDRTDGLFHFTSTIPMIRAVGGTIDTNNSKGIVDIIFEIKTFSRPL